MAIVSVGYDGTVDEAQWSKFISKVGNSEYGVDLAGDFKVSVSSGDRAISVAPGKAWGLGVYDESDSVVNLLLSAPATGSRWDLVVLRRDWQPPGGNTAVAVVEGSATKAIPAGRITGQFGVQDDQPIALVRIQSGSTTVQEIVDLRVWSRNGGQMLANDDLVRSYAGALGTVLNIKGQLWQRVIGDNDTAAWENFGTRQNSGWQYAYGFASGWGGPGAYMAWKVRDGLVQLRAVFTRTGPDINTTTGDFGNVKVFTVPISGRPSSDWAPLSSGPSGPLLSAHVGSSGEVFADATTPGQAISTGMQYSLGGFYFID